MLLALAPSPASAHSLDSSTLSVHVGDEGVDATVSVALETITAVLGEGASDAEVVAYLGEHLSVVGVDGTVWDETWSELAHESVDGLASVSAEVALDTAGADPSSFTLTYDAVIEADSSHEAVVVLTDAAGDISTPGVLTATDDSLQLGDTPDVGWVDMVGLGFHHVLEGADHLLFLLTLLLVAPLAVSAGRWRRRDGVAPTARRVLHVVTAFTVGHSLTLVASSLGWVSLDATLVEVLIAASVGVSAVHAIRPLVRGGEVLIAGGFGLVHGLAFAGILGSLGLSGSTSLVALLAFNLGVELAQLVTVTVVFPSLYVASRTRSYPAVRVAAASFALLASCGWAADRLGLLANPLAELEAAAIEHPWWVVAGVALVARGCWSLEKRRSVSEAAPRVVADHR